MTLPLEYDGMNVIRSIIVIVVYLIVYVFIVIVCVQSFYVFYEVLIVNLFELRLLRN